MNFRPRFRPRGEELSVDRIISRAVVPELDNVITSRGSFFFVAWRGLSS